MGNTWNAYKNPSAIPDIFSKPTFDPNYGFSEGRKPREAKVTEEEMLIAGLKPEERDYCAHELIRYRKCISEHYFGYFSCADAHHAWHACEREDTVLRMKEYERERRLLERQQRKEAAASA